MPTFGGEAMHGKASLFQQQGKSRCFGWLGNKMKQKNNQSHSKIFKPCKDALQHNYYFVYFYLSLHV